jgi:WD40 repeat protein
MTLRWYVVLFLATAHSAALAADGRKDIYGDPLPPGAIARMGTVRWRIPPGVSDSSCWFINDRTLITGSIGHDWWAWDARTGRITGRVWKKIQTTEHLGGWVASNGFSFDGAIAALGTTDGVVETYDLISGAQLKSWHGHEGAVRSIAFSQKGERVATRSVDGSVRIWNARTARLVARIVAPTSGHPGGPDQFNALAVSPDGNLLAWAGVGADRAIHLFDVVSGRERDRIRNAGPEVHCVAFSPNGNFLAFAAAERPLRLWDVVRSREVWKSKREASSGSLEHVWLLFSRDGRWLAASQSYSAVILFDVATGEALWNAGERGGNAGQIAFAPDSKSIAALGALQDRTIYRYDVRSGRQITDGGHFGSVDHLWFTSDGRSCVTSARDGVLRVWDPDSGKLVRTRPDSGFSIQAITADGEPLILDGVLGSLHLYDFMAGKDRWRFKPHSVTDAAALAPNGRDVITSGLDEKGKDNLVQTISVWDSLARKERWSASIAERGIWAFVYSSDGRALLCPSASGEAVLRFNSVTGRQLSARSLNKDLGLPLAVSPDRRTIVFVDGGGLALFETLTLEQRCRLTSKGVPNTAAFSSDGTLLAAGWGDFVALDTVYGAWQVWDARSGRTVAHGVGQWGPVCSVVLSPDGRCLATGSDDTTALVWNLPAAKPPATAPRALDLEPLWNALASRDAAEAYRAMGQLIAVPDQTLSLFRAKLQPTLPPDSRHLSDLVSNLNSASFAARERATARLASAGPPAVAFLRRVQAEVRSPEVRHRIAHILAKIEDGTSSPEELRMVRAIEVLEQIGTEGAKRVLAKLATGASTAPVTCEASDSLLRVTKRSH